jgi:hypothetical protein
MERIAIRLISEMLTEGNTPAEHALVDWIPLMTGNQRIESKTSVILEGLPSYKRPFGDQCHIVEGGIIAGSRLITSALIGHPSDREVKWFLAKMQSFVSGAADPKYVAARHACILGLMRTYILIKKHADKDCWTFPLDIAMDYIPKWVTTHLTFPVVEGAASEQATLMSGFLAALKTFGNAEEFGRTLRRAVTNNQRAATIGLEQFVDSYTMKFNNQLERNERLKRLHPLLPGEVDEPLPLF